MNRTTLLTSLLAALALGAAAPAGAIELVPVADSSMPFPGGSTLLLEATEPAPCDLGVVFHAVDFETLAGALFVATPTGIEILVDETTPVPRGTGTFRDLGGFRCDGSRVVLRGRDGAAGPYGLYRWSGGSLERLVVQGDPVPGTGAGIAGLPLPEVDGERLLFSTTLGLAALPALVAGEGGELRALVTAADPVPGSPGGSFQHLSQPARGDDGVTFGATVGGLGTGIYRYRESDGLLSAVVTRGTPVPGGDPGGETFDTVGGPHASADGSEILFLGHGPSDPAGLYAASGGTLRPVVLPGSPAPPSGEPFLEIRQPIPLSRGFAFLSETQPLREALYVLWDGRLQRVVGAGDLLDGKTVASVIAGGRGDRLAVRVFFIGNSQALYSVELGSLIEVPALRPVGVGLLVLLLGGAGVWGLRRGAKIHEGKARHA